MHRITAITLALLPVLLASGVAAGEQPPRIVVYTMGPGDDVFSKFGHAAICVHDERSPAGRCYNYGTADFTTPVPLTWSVLRGRAQFWVSVTSLERMLATYAGYDRTVYRQTLELPPEAAAELARRLAHDARPENRFYRYHHFRDNCTTRIRDHLDAVTGGRLRAATSRPHNVTYRTHVRSGFATSLPLIALSELLIGRAVDRYPTVWEAMFLPDVFRTELERHLGARPEVVHARRAPLRAGSLGAGLFAITGAGLVLGGAVAGALGRGGHATRRAAVVGVGLTLGLLAVVLDALALASTLPELRANELLLVFFPTDLALVALGPARRKAYARVRLALLLPVALLAAGGVLIQPIWAPLSLVFSLLAPIALGERLSLAAGRALGERSLLDRASGR